MLRFSISFIFILPSLLLLSCGSLSYTQRTLNKNQQAQKAQQEAGTPASTMNSLQKKEFKSLEKPVENELILPDLAQDAGELITL